MTANVSELETYSAYLNGEWKTSESGETIAIKSPYLRKTIGYVQAVTQHEVDQAIAGARVAQQAWAELTLSKRGEYLLAWADALIEDQEDIARTVMQEVGKGYKDAVKEVVRTADLIRYTVEEAMHLHGESLSGESFPGGSRNKIGIVERAPLGVVLAISPFNYPINLAASKIAPALVAGNGVIFKPATQGAISGIKMIRSLDKVGLPKGLLSLTTGRGSVIGDYLVEHKGIDMISFTGGSGTGRRLSKLSSMIPLVLELGGKDPAIVCDDADLDVAISSIINGAFSYSGQRCTAIKRVLVNEKVADELVARLKDAIEKLSVGSPEDNATIVPLIDDKSADFVQSLIDDALSKKATLITGNTRHDNLIYPTLLDNVTEEMDVAWIEPFGPILPVIRVAGDDEAISIANRSEFGLQASVFSQDIDRALAVARQVEAGTVQINGRTERGPDHFPFLGVKNSGMGVQGIHNSLLSMTRQRVTVLNLK
ncbi:MAG: NADP-dependent glyceraldehyde-3-phosphate dehydrogenase [Sporolactobacillus sp.]